MQFCSSGGLLCSPAAGCAQQGTLPCSDGTCWGQVRSPGSWLRPGRHTATLPHSSRAGWGKKHLAHRRSLMSGKYSCIVRPLPFSSIGSRPRSAPACPAGAQPGWGSSKPQWQAAQASAQLSSPEQRLPARRAGFPAARVQAQSPGSLQGFLSRSGSGQVSPHTERSSAQVLGTHRSLSFGFPAGVSLLCPACPAALTPQQACADVNKRPPCKCVCSFGGLAGRQLNLQHCRPCFAMTQCTGLPLASCWPACNGIEQKIA